MSKNRRKIAAGVLIMAKDTKRFLVALRSSLVNDPLTYSSFGGGIDDADKSPIHGVLRELAEETGFTGKVNFVHTYITTIPDSGAQYFNFIGITKTEFIPKLNFENDAFEWLTLDELISLPKLHPKFKEFLVAEFSILSQISTQKPPKKDKHKVTDYLDQNSITPEADQEPENAD